MNGFLSMNILSPASRVRHYGFTICKTDIGFMQEVDLNTKREGVEVYRLRLKKKVFFRGTNDIFLGFLCFL